MDISKTMLAWNAHTAGDGEQAYKLATQIGFPAPIESLRYRALLLARYGSNREALPAIGQYGAVAAREGALKHMVCAELLAALRVDAREVGAHIGRVDLIKPKLEQRDWASLYRELHELFQHAPETFQDRIGALKPPYEVD